MNQPRFDYDPRGKLIVCSEGAEVIGHDGGDEHPIWLFRAEEPVVGLAICGAGVVVADAVGSVITLDPAQGEEVSREAIADEVRGLAATPEGALAILGAHGVQLRLPGGAERLIEGGGVRCAAFSFDGGRLALGHEDGRVRVLRLPGLELAGEHRQDGAIVDICAGPEDRWLAACGDRVLRVAADGSSSARMTGMQGARIHGVLVRRDGRLIGIVADSRLVVYLHYPSLETVANFDYADKEVTNLAYGPHPWVGIGLHTGDGNKVNLVSGAMHRTDTHPERQHHSWLVMQSIDGELARGLLAGESAHAPAPAARPEAARPAEATLQQPGAQPAGKRWKRFPNWYTAVWMLLLVLYVIFTIVYRLGGDEITVKGATLDLGRKYDHALFKIDEQRAFSISGSGHISVVKYCSGVFPLKPLCGFHSLDGSVLNLADYKKGDWVYSGYPELGGRSAVNIRTGEVIETERTARRRGDYSRSDPARVPGYARLGLTFDERLRLTPAAIVHGCRQLSVINESCLTYTVAFLLLFALWLMVGVPLALRRQPRA